MTTVFANNLKKFRQQKGLTQEQVAAALGVNAQTISRWECSTTLPDVTLLPDLARLYSVTTDDFFKETTSIYQNYAQRLACVYEKSRNPEDFLRADLEFRQLQKSGAYSYEDMRMHGMIHQFMMWYCREKALTMYNTIIENEPDKDSETYWMTRYAKVNIYVLLGRAAECIAEQLERVHQNPNHPEEWAVLIRAFFYAKQYEEGHKYFLDAAEKFSDYWRLYPAGGDICWKLKRYEEAFCHWNRARELAPDRTGALQSMAACYEELGDLENAYQTRCRLVELLKKGGYEIEAAEQEKKAQKCL